MKYEPDVDHTHLLQTVRAVYNLPAERLSFIAVGFDAVCYVLDGAGAERFFLKLWPETRVRYTSISQRERTLCLVRALYDRGLYPHVSYPLPTRNGALWTDSAVGPFAVFPFLSGHTLPAEWPLVLQDEFARVIATIHRATPALNDVLPERETFDIPFEVDLIRGLQTIQNIGPHDRSTLHALRTMIMARHDDILAQLTRLHKLQYAVRRLSGPFVLCHTDIGGDNLLVDDDGRLYVLDWDGATLAPPEHDLQEARWLDLERVLATYMAAGGSGPLYLDHFAFYLLRRHLHDMTVRLLLILAGNGSIAEEEDGLAGIKAWGFDQWSGLDTTLNQIQAALRHVQ